MRGGTELSLFVVAPQRSLFNHFGTSFNEKPKEVWLIASLEDPEKIENKSTQLASPRVFKPKGEGAIVPEMEAPMAWAEAASCAPRASTLRDWVE
jgi:hypothetical protein